MLSAGTKIGNYEITGAIGAGGMGEVYRARDTRLDRDVAIKSLPESVAGQSDRLQRFEREAKLLASLNHPNIAAIYGLEDVSGSSYIVLELIEGESLGQRLARGPLEVRETLEIGMQVASAIEAAHERGIVHRDLKPSNVMITKAGAAKVLDFGLAKGTPEGPGGPYALTMTHPATADGLILGTAPYMSPEQARGKEVDRRTDVWAFGCLLYECLTARQAFSGETASDVIAGILEREPDWDGMPAAVPPRLRELIARCLTKEAQDRPRDIGDLRRELVAILSDISSPGRSATRASSSLPSLAVLYFENLANDAESEYFCAGITEDILTDLSKIKGLRVSSRNAVQRYRGAPADIPRVAAELGVRAVLEGSVRRSGDRVRISAQLINASDGFHLWAERYDRKMADVFDVQEEISKSIAEALRVALTPTESQNLVQNRPNDARAYDLYLKGRQKYGLYKKEEMAEALRLFKEATEIDPNYALAWAGMADCYGQMVQWGMTKEIDESVRLGIDAADRAIAINPLLAEGYKARGLVMRVSGNGEGERRALLKAIEVNPRFTPALINLGVEFYASADIAGAERSFRRALEIDPQEAFATTWLAAVLLDTMRLDESGAMLERLRKIAPNPFYFTTYYLIRTNLELARGEVERASRTVEEGLKEGADAANLKASRSLVAAHLGRAEETKAIFRELVGQQGLMAGAAYSLAEAAIRIGEPELAIPYINLKIIGDIFATNARIAPALHPILDHLGPRRSEKTLIWPIEAPMPPASTRALFRQIQIESGMPEGSSASAIQ